jgi:hypothetical protein
LRQADALAIDDEGIAFDRDLALEAAMDRIVLQHVGQVVGLELIVDGNDFDVAEILHGGAQHIAANAAEAVDTYLDGHLLFAPVS